jgi:hypothetical protein
MAHTLGAFGWVDFINFRPQIDSLVGAFGFTHIAVDAFVGDHQSHVLSAKVDIIQCLPCVQAQALKMSL